MPSDTVTVGGFLGERVTALQPSVGFRSGIDAVLLAASVPAVAGESALELGAGAGVASLCLAARVPGLHIVAVERQEVYAELARRNAAQNQAPIEVVAADLARLPAALRARGFDHVFLNPPYFAPGTRSESADRGREAALAEETPLDIWLDVAVRRLAPGGCLTLIQRADRLADVLGGLDDRVGAVEVLPLHPRRNRPSHMFLLRARKGRRTPMLLLPPQVLHAGERHEEDGEDYDPQIGKVLRDAAPMPWLTA